MRSITQYGTGYIYTTKASAWRTAKNSLGHGYYVEAEELGSRFDGEIIITPEMLSVEPCNRGWRWLYTFSLADVIVGVLHYDGTITEEPFGDVAGRWQDASMSPVDEQVA